MQDERGSGSICWTRASCIAALLSGSAACLLLGMLAGVMAAGGHASDVIPAITNPVAPAPAQADTTSRPHHGRHQLARTVTVTIPGTDSTRTVTVSRPAVTVSQTVTVTSTETVTEPPPTSSSSTGAP